MKLKLHLLSILILAFLASCSVSNDVANGRLIQKRKYNNGFYTSFGKLFHNQVESHEAAKVNAIETLENEIGAPDLLTENTNTAIEAPVFIEDENVIDVPVYEPLAEVIEVSGPAETDHTIAQPADITSGKSITVRETIGRVYKKHSIPTVVSTARQSTESTLMLILLVILCFIIPPVSVAVVDGISQRFWIDLIFFILGWGVGGYFFRSGLAYLCTLVAIIYALLIVLGAI